MKPVNGTMTIMGAWEGYEKGWREVGARYEAVAARLKESGTRVKVGIGL